jgi:hypothetical protein
LAPVNLLKTESYTKMPVSTVPKKATAPTGIFVFPYKVLLNFLTFQKKYPAVNNHCHKVMYKKQ